MLVAAVEQHDVAQGSDSIGNKGCNAKILAIFSIGIAGIKQISNLRMVSEYVWLSGSYAIQT